MFDYLDDDPDDDHENDHQDNDDDQERHTRRRRSKVERQPDTVLHFISGQRGNPKLVIDGYSYVRNKGNDANVYWRCAKKRATRCKAKAVTNIDMNKCTLSYPEHNHDRDVFKWTKALPEIKMKLQSISRLKISFVIRKWFRLNLH